MPDRTTATDPIRVDWVTVGPGRLGMTACPGRTGPDDAGRPAASALDADIAALRAAGAGLLVTLIEADELLRPTLRHIAGRAEAHGLDWIHLPIRDMHAPDDGFERAWAVWGPLLRARLDAGGRVVVHCRGGLGRTGTVAARLLIETGAAPADALATVRAARPGTVETAAQQAHLAALAPPAADSGWVDRLAACLVGGALGDAFGYAVEFDRLATIRLRHGPEGLRAPLLSRGRLVASDDTQMTLFTAWGLLDALETGADPAGDPAAVLAAIRAATLDWARTQFGRPGAQARGLFAHRALWAARAPGNTCLSACARGATGTPEAPINRSKGCGGVMRVAPLGLLPGLPAEAAFDLAARAAAQTHGHPSGYLSAGAMAATIRLALSGVALAHAAAEAARLAARWPHSGETCDAIEAALAAPRTGDRTAEIGRLGEGWVGEEAFAMGLYAALAGRDWPDMLALAANHDGDSDSTASIAGQLRGAAEGGAGLPLGWVRRLDLLEPAAAVVSRWLALAGRGHRGLPLDSPA